MALEKGTRGTNIMQQLFRELCRPHFGGNSCNRCPPIDPKQNFFQHAIELHSELIGIEDFEKDILTLVTQDTCDALFNKLTQINNCKVLWTQEEH